MEKCQCILPEEKLQIIAIVPVFNPKKILFDVINSLHQINQVNTGACHIDKIIVVDDGSFELESLEVIHQIRHQDDIVVLPHITNLGKGAALKTAFEYWGGKLKQKYHFALTLDGDGQHKIDDIYAVLQESKNLEYNAMVLGVRNFTNVKVPFRNYWGNTIFKHLIKFFSKLDLHDTQSGLRVYPLTLVNKLCRIKANKFDFELECLLLAARNNIPIHQIPIKANYDLAEYHSSFRPIHDSWHIIGALFKNKHRKYDKK